MLAKTSLLALLCLASCAHLGQPRALPARPHPLDPLSVSEHERTFAAVRAQFAADASLPHENLRYPLLALAEPPKAQLLAWRDGQPFTRQTEVQIMHTPSARVWIARVDLAQGRVVQLRELPRGTQPALAASEYSQAAALVHSYEPWLSALRQRGIDPKLVYTDLWAPGHFELPPDTQLSFGPDTRLMRVLTFYRGAPPDTNRVPQNPYDRPVEGLVLTIDLNAMKVVHMSDSGPRPVSLDSGNASRTEPLKPLRTTQPQGSDVILEGHRVRWHGFQFVLGFHPRDGLVLHDLRYQDHGVLRPIAYRMALSEIYVPYGLGDPAWQWRSAFDVGEYNAGALAQPLEPNADVPPHAQLLDMLVASDRGPQADDPHGVRQLPRAVGLYERDAGVLWTRTDPTTGSRDTRRARELVVTWSAWLGNYIYSFDWVFKLDGSIEVITHLDGTTLNRGTSELPEPSAPKIGKDAYGTFVAAPHHQHFVNFRLDLDVDGSDNGLMEMEVAPLHDAAFKNAFDTTMLHLHSEGARDLSPQTARHWHVESGHQQNALGKPTSYAIEAGAYAVPYSAPDFPGLLRAGFATHQLWFTRYREGELYAAGDFPYQGSKPEGVAQYCTPAEPLTPRDDLVLWYTTGFTHVARPEDHPVMPGEQISFRLVPRGFFAQNPALEVQDLRAQ